jgi:hypothetical protein
MRKSMLKINAPKLNDEAVESLHNFLYELLDVFESHYYCQLQRYQRHLSRTRFLENLIKDEETF